LVPIRFECPACHRELNVPDSSAGQRGRCPHCDAVINVPDPSPPATSAAPVPEPAAPVVEPPPEPAPPARAPSLELPPFEEPRAEAPADAWLPRLVVGLLMLTALVALAIRGYLLHYVHSALGADAAAQYAAFVKLATAMGVLIMAAALGVLVAGVEGLRLRVRGRTWLLGALAVFLALHVVHVALINVPALHPPGPDGGSRWRLLELVYLAASLVVCGPALFYVWRFDTSFGGKLTVEGPDVVRLVDEILTQALHARASDVHFEPTPEGVAVRFRVDGVLHPVMTYPPRALERLISRIKVMAKMDIAEKRLPQDGGATLVVGNKGIDLRISTVPSSYGERAVVRLLDPSTSIYGLEGLGMAQKLLVQMDELIENPHGVFFCTGPTGSGKTTTLYAALLRIDSSERNVITVEDPVEYQLPGISQLPVGKKKGMSFVSGLRSILRQDPDVIMVGEVRDRETADMVIRAAQTGHLVLSTLHTNDSAGAVARLMDLGVEPFLLASSLTAVLAQRLVRRVCEHCAEEYTPTPEEVKTLGLEYQEGLVFKRGAGCDRCLNTGFYGRIGLFELLRVDDPVRELIMGRADAWTIRRAALDGSMTALKADGVAKVLAGITTPREVRRVTQGSIHE
jgi:general secretion pathway protein E